MGDYKETFYAKETQKCTRDAEEVKTRNSIIPQKVSKLLTADTSTETWSRRVTDAVAGSW